MPMKECYFKKSCTTTLLKVSLLHGCFSRFLNCTNCTKSRKVVHINLEQELVAISASAPPRWNPPCRGEGAYH